ncbi:nitrate reductase molybdenum cofactor assembly chaperone [Agrilactobacillus composti DSM 18527 = JCM 14202]|uniref:Nitrate reductase molybdenum cofactor assembly chaperone n=1 Tax=Agrilactobacillus composti DSM 18527 = JCM 14202 TaxID=1423734 RepID=A0A0R1Y0B9_9LACO|nr:nitrate reductase molybdenum cofactor assembly chaperone [Agrilactobacillus composti DSM 18527 = JCM 14202]
MGGFGVINFKVLNQTKGDFYYLSHLLDYPQDELQSPEFLTNFQKEYSASAAKAEVQSIIQQFQQQSLEDLRLTYSDFFEMNKRFTLYMTFYRFEDSRQRGQVLAKLKMLYEMFGVSAAEQELTDYLPLMLEFLSYGDWANEPAVRTQDMQLLFSVLEDGTYRLLENGAIYQDEPYFRLIKIIRQELAKCVTDRTIITKTEV